MATIGYKTTDATERMLNQIEGIVNASGSCMATANALYAAKMFERVEMSASEMKEHISSVLSGGDMEQSPELPRTEKEALGQEAAKRGLTVEFQPYTMLFKRGGA